MDKKVHLSAARRETSPRYRDVPRQTVLLGRRNRQLDPPEFRHDLVLLAGPDPDVLHVDVVSGRPELEPRTLASLRRDHVLENVVAFLLSLDDDQARLLQLAHLLGLDPAHPVVGE